MSAQEKMVGETGAAGQQQRFHLLFRYEVRPGHGSSGEQVVIAASLQEAAERIMRERGISSLRVRKRFHFGRPASEANIIERDFHLQANGGAQ